MELRDTGAGLLYGYRRDWLRRDLLAGVATAAVVVPQAMAYATIAGLPVQTGLYCALVPMAVYALLGTSRPLSVSTTSTISVLTAESIALVHEKANAATAALTLAVMTGAILLIAAVLRLGFIADFIPQSVVVGFKTGIGLVIAAGQLGKILGVDVKGDGFFDQIASALGQLGDASLTTVAVAAGTIAALLLLRRRPALPGPLIVIAGVTLVSALAHLDDHGVATVGSVPSGLPLPMLPHLDLVGRLLPAALGISLIAFLESIAAARIFRKRTDRPLNADRELFALGAANLAGGFFQAYPTAGGLSQTAVNDSTGARSQGAELVTSVCAAAVLLALAPLIAPLPLAALGGLILVIVTGLIDIPELLRIGRIRPPEFVLALVALGAGITLGLLQAVVVSSVLALLMLLYETNHPPVYVLGRDPATGAYRELANHPGDETEPGLLIVRIESRLYFANARRVTERVLHLVRSERSPPHVLLLDLAAVPGVDITAAEVVQEFHDELAEREITLWFAIFNFTRHEMLWRTEAGRRLRDSDRLYRTVADAVAHYRATAASPQAGND
jgi:high affinity sulfate transporter 1